MESRLTTRLVSSFRTLSYVLFDSTDWYTFSLLRQSQTHVLSSVDSIYCIYLLYFFLFQVKIEPSEVVQSLKILGINISEKQAEKILQRSEINILSFFNVFYNSGNAIVERIYNLSMVMVPSVTRR